MSATKRYRQQHEDLLKIAAEISAHLNVTEISNNAKVVRSLLSKLLGTLKIHLSMEDKSLYPRLLENKDEKVKAAAKEFIDEMGHIGEAVKAYDTNWPTASSIQNDANGFIKQTKGIFDALAKRIDRENNVLYKIVDEL